MERDYNNYYLIIQGDIQYLVEYYSDKYEPSDISFNVISQDGKIYVVYG